MSKWDRYPSNAGVHPPQRYKYPSDRALRDAVDRFRGAHPDVTTVYIAAVRGDNLTVELHVEIADGVIAWKWDTGRSKWTPGLAQSARLEELLTAGGISVYRRRPW